MDADQAVPLSQRMGSAPAVLAEVMNRLVDGDLLPTVRDGHALLALVVKAERVASSDRLDRDYAQAFLYALDVARDMLDQEQFLDLVEAVSRLPDVRSFAAGG